MPAKYPYKIGDEPVPGYRLVKFLGRGGFGEVWKSTAPGGASAALKIISSLSGKQGRKEFRALGIVKGIQHANIVPITAVWLKDGEGNVLDDSIASQQEILAPNRTTDIASQTLIATPTSTDPISAELIIAMGLGHKSLFDRLQECQDQGMDGIPPTELLEYMEEAARAIDYLNSASHTLGSTLVAVQHCDIKPHNLLIVGTAVQVCDFGLARVRGDVRATATMAGSVAYAAPECLQEEVGPSASTDQYSLAVTYYELRTGSLPYRDDSFMEVMRTVMSGDLDLAKLPPAEEAVVRRATSLEPEKRFGSTMEMVKALRKAVESPESFTETTSVEYRRSPLLKIVSLLLAVGLGVSVWWYYPQLQRWVQSQTVSAEALTKEGIDLLARGKPDEAIRRFGRALDEDDKYAPAHIARAEAFLGTKSFDRAIDDLEAAKRLDPKSYRSQKIEAKAHHARGVDRLGRQQFDQAVADFDAARTLDPANYSDHAEYAQAYIRRGEAHFQRKEFDAAIADFTAAIDDHSSFAEEARQPRGLCLLEKGEFARALADLEWAAANRPQSVEMLIALARSRLGAKDYAKAIADLEQAKSLDSRGFDQQGGPKPLADAHHARGLDHLAGGRYAEAIADFAAARQLAPQAYGPHESWAKAYLALGQSQAEKGDLDQAIQTYELARQLDVDGKLGYRSRAEYADAYLVRAAARRQLKEYEQAIQDATAVTEQYPDRAAAGFLERGACYRDQGDLNKALADFDQAIQRDPKNGLAFSRRGYVRLRLKQYPAAIEDFTAAIQLEPDDLDYYNRAIAYSASGETNRAIEEFTHLIQKNPDDPDAHLQRALAYEEGHDYDQAITDWREVVRLLPDKPDGYSRLAWLLACKPGATRATAAEAVQQAKQACVFSNWTAAEYLDVLAAALAAAGSFDEAVQRAQEAVRLADPGNKSDYESRLALYRQKRPYKLSQ